MKVADNSKAGVAWSVALMLNLSRGRRKIELREFVLGDGVSIIGANGKAIPWREAHEAFESVRPGLANVDIGRGGVVDVDEVRDLIGEIGRADRNAAWQQGLFDAAIEASARFRL
jgi:hypothetical protein